MQDHEPITFKGFNGVFNRGNISEVPDDHLWDAINWAPNGEDIGPRDGFDTIAYNGTNVLRVRPFLTSSFRRYFILRTGGNLYDSIDMVNPILTIAAMSDFAVQVINDRAYISPHNGSTGLSGQSLYVYDRALATTARVAAGAAPATQVTLAVGAAGKPEIGTHVVAYSYEYNTGFITAPGGHNSITLTGHTIIAASTIANGPANVVKKWVWMSKAQLNWNGDLTTPELFLVSVINDNVTTTLNIDVYDTQLISSADEYLDRLSAIPAGVAMCAYQGRLVIVGENANKGYARISNPGAPESFNSTSGFVPCFKGDLGWLKNCVEDNGVLYLFRLDNTYSTFDNGGPPNTWKPSRVAPIGTGPEGIATVFEDKGKVGGVFLIQTRYGLAAFNGQYDPIPLTWKIDRKWQDFHPTYLLANQVACDPINKRIYFIQRPNDGSTVYKLWMGDYAKGLNFQSIRWFEYQVSNVHVSVTGSYHSVFVIWDYNQARSSVIIATGDGPFYSVYQRVQDYNNAEFAQSFILPALQGTLGKTVDACDIVVRAITTRNDFSFANTLAFTFEIDDELGNVSVDSNRIVHISRVVRDSSVSGEKWYLRYEHILLNRKCKNVVIKCLNIQQYDADLTPVGGSTSGMKMNQIDVHLIEDDDMSPLGAQ